MIKRPLKDGTKLPLIKVLRKLLFLVFSFKSVLLLFVAFKVQYLLLVFSFLTLTSDNVYILQFCLIYTCMSSNIFHLSPCFNSVRKKIELWLIFISMYFDLHHLICCSFNNHFTNNFSNLSLSQAVLIV